MSGIALLIEVCTADSDNDALWLVSLSHTSVIQIASALAGSRATT